MALIRGRDFVLPDEVKELAVPILSHRIIVSASARMRGIQPKDIVGEIVDEAPVPGAQAKGWVRR
jgi:MoxR-like ATPase